MIGATSDRIQHQNHLASHTAHIMGLVEECEWWRYVGWKKLDGGRITPLGGWCFDSQSVSQSG
jgi:hypothetical protein